jgi:hypothetical protein
MAEAGLGYSMGQPAAGLGEPMAQQPQQFQRPAPTMSDRRTATLDLMRREGLTAREAAVQLGYEAPAVEPAEDTAPPPAADEGGLGFIEQAGVGLQSAGEQALRGTGRMLSETFDNPLTDAIGGAFEAAGGKVGPSDESEARLAEEMGQIDGVIGGVDLNGYGGRMIEGAIEGAQSELGPMAAAIGGVWAGRKFKGKTAKTLATMGVLMNSVGRAFDQGSQQRDDANRAKIAAQSGRMPDEVTDEEVRAAYTDEDNLRSMGAGATGLVEVLPIARMLKVIPGAEEIAKKLTKGGVEARNAMLAAGKEGLTTGMLEAGQEYTQSAITDLLTDEDTITALRERGDQSLLGELYDLASGAKGVEWATGALSGFGLGAGPGGYNGAKTQQARNEYAKQQAAQLEDTARQRGSSSDDINAAITNGNGKVVAQVAKEIDDHQIKLNHSEEMLREAQTAMEKGNLDPKDIPAFEGLVEKRKAQLDTYMDGVGAQLGIKTWQNKADVDRAKTVEAAERRRSALDRLAKYGETADVGVDQETVTKSADRLDKTESRVEQLRMRAESITNPERKAEAQVELDNAREDSRKARVDARMALKGMTHGQATNAIKADAARTVTQRRRDDQATGRERAVERQLELEMPASMPEAQRKVRAQEILDEDAAGEKADKGLDGKITRLQRQRRAATTDTDIDKLTNEIADLEARRGLPTPAVEAARRVLQVPLAQSQAGTTEVSPGAGITDGATPSKAAANAAGKPSSTTTPAGDGAIGAGVANPLSERPKPAGAAASFDPETTTVDSVTEAALELDQVATTKDRQVASAKMTQLMPGASADSIALVTEAATQLKDPDISIADRVLLEDTIQGEITKVEKASSKAAAAAPAPAAAAPAVDTAGYDIPDGAKYRDLTAKFDQKNGVLYDFMREQTKASGNEVGAHMRDGKPIAVGTNDLPNAIMPPRNGYADPDVTFVHTHITDTPFSAADIRGMLHSGQPFVALLPNGETLTMKPIGGYDAKAQALMTDLLTRIAERTPRYLSAMDRARIRQEAMLQLLEINGNLSYDTPFAGLSEPHMEIVNGIVTEFEATLPRDGARKYDGAGLAQDADRPVGPARTADQEVDADETDNRELLDENRDEIDAEFDDIGSGGILENQSLRSARRDRRPSFNRERVKQLAADTVAARSKRGKRTEWYQDYLKGDLPIENIEKALEKAVEMHTFKKAMVLPEVARAMYPDMKLTEADFAKEVRKQSGSKRDGKDFQKLIDKKKELHFKAALELVNSVRYSGHGAFGRQTNDLMSGKFGFRTMFHEASQDLMDFVEFGTAENARFDPPVEDAGDVSNIKRKPSQMRFSDEAMMPLERTAKYLQANTYQIDKKRLYALRPDDLISGKAYGDFGFMKGDVARLDELQKLSRDKWNDDDVRKFDNADKFFEARRKAKYKLDQLRTAYADFVGIYGENSDVGFMYQVDSRGRIYADGSFHPQAGSKIKALFKHNGVSLGDMVEVDNAASGWQINALIARDGVAAPKLNMGAGQATEAGFKKQDLYTDTLNNMRGLMKRDAEMDISGVKGVKARRDAAAKKKNAQLFLDGPFREGVTIPVDRASIKPAIIAVNYGGGTENFRKIFMATLKNHVDQQRIKGGMAAKEAPWGYVSNLGLEALRETAPHALAFQDWAIQSIGKVVDAVEANSKATDAPKVEISIGLDGRFAAKKYGRLEGETKARSSAEGQLAFEMEGNTKKEKKGPDGLLIPIMLPNGQQAVKADQVTVPLIVNRGKVDGNKTGRAYFANMIQSFDAQILHRSVERYKKATNGAFITTNHDSFTVPPEHEGAISAAVRESMASVMTEVDVPGRLYAELMSEAARYGVTVDIRPFDGMGDYNMDDLGSSSPLFGEAPGRPDDFIPTYDVLPDTEPFLRAGVDPEPDAVAGQPAPLYVNRPVRNGADIKAWAEAQGLPVTVPLNEMHVTTAYSTAPVDVGSTPPDTQGRRQVAQGGKIEKFGDNLVLVLEPDAMGLAQDYQKYRDAGASYDFPAYRPHITLNTDAGDVNIDNIAAFNGEVSLGREDQRQLAKDDTNPTDPDKQPLPSAGVDVEMANYMEQIERPQTLLNRMQAFAQSPGKLTAGFFLEVERSLTNGFQPIRTLELKASKDGTLGVGMDSAFKAAEMAVNDSGRNEALLYYGAGSLGQFGEFRPAKGTVGLRDIFNTASGGKKDGQRLQHWFEYMAALRARELKAEGITVPLTDAEIQTAIAREGQDFKDARAQWQAHNKANLKMLVDAGRISTEQFDAMATDDFYVPFYRADQRMDGTSPDLQLPEFKRTSGGALRMRDPGIMAMKGGDKMRISNMAENMIRNSQAMTAAAMRNVAANKTFDLMETAGIVKFAPNTVARKPNNAIARFKDGKEDWVVPQGDDAIMVVAALGGLTPIQVDGFAAAMNGIASIFRSGITSKPSFILNNLWRGALANGILTQGANLTASNNTLTGAISALGGWNNQAYQDFKQLSGMGDYRMGQVETGFGKNDILVDIGLDGVNPGYAMRKVWNKWETLGTASEMADRIAIFETMKANGARQDEAAYQALNVMNYARKGGNATVRHWITTMPFMNARLQGYSRLLEGTVGKSATPETRKAALGKMAMTGLLYTAATAAAWGWNNEDEERREIYQDLPAWRRQMFFNVVMPSGFVLTLPQPFELGFIFSSIPTSIMDSLGSAVPFAPDDMDTIEGAGIDITTKIIKDTLAFNFIPQALMPIFEGRSNFNSFFEGPIETRAETSLDPDLRDTNSDEFARTVGQDIKVPEWVPMVGGDNLSNVTRISPAMITHYGSNYGGVPYTLMASLFDTFAGDAGLAPKRPAGMFGGSSMAQFSQGVVRGFAFDPSMSRDRWTEEYYKNGREATERMRSFKDTSEVDRLKGAPAGSQVAYSLFNKTNSVVSDLSKQERAIKDSALSPAEKRRMLQAITKARNTLMEGISRGMATALEPK